MPPLDLGDPLEPQHLAVERFRGVEVGDVEGRIRGWPRVCIVAPQATAICCRSTSRAMPLLARPISASELLLRERHAFGRALDLDDAALAGHDEIGVGAGRRILEIVEVEHRLAVMDAAGDRRDMVLQHLLDA